MSLRQAQQAAEEAELDLVEISPTAKPPVCRIMDFGKFKYQESKKQHEGQPLSLINCGIGTIALAGIIVNNNIVFIHTFNKLRETGMALREAILRTCALRLRPVLLTKVTMILGLLPMAMKLNIELMQRQVYFGGPGTAWWSQMASVIIGGLIFASVLTLLLTPSILMIQGRVQERRAARRARRAGPSVSETATA